MTSFAVANAYMPNPSEPGNVAPLRLVHDLQESGPVLEVDVRRACRLRQLRKTLLGEVYFTGPAWGILLQLFHSHLLQVRETIGSLQAGTGTPTTTVLRWAERLESEGLAASRGDPLDARRRFVELTSEGADLMTRYFKGASAHLIAA
jgi:DNA-binding MarR family transcriptional regulator